MRLVLKGKFAQLREQMETADPTLQAWMPYLTAACKFLLRRSFHHLLYEIQVFMRVSVVVILVAVEEDCERELSCPRTSHLKPGAIIGDGDRKRALILLLGLSP